jgi:hypothetical protein
MGQTSSCFSFKDRCRSEIASGQLYRMSANEDGAAVPQPATQDPPC